jgi:hypothetical protein
MKYIVYIGNIFTVSNLLDIILYIFYIMINGLVWNKRIAKVGTVCILEKFWGSRFVVLVVNFLRLVTLFDVPEQKIECFWSIDVKHSGLHR